MDFTSEKRKDGLVQFMNFIEGEYADTDTDKTISSFFKLRELASGVEGQVYKATNKSKKYKNMVIVIKKVDLIAIKRSKDINRFTLNATPDALYELFESKKVFNNSALIELIGCTLANQLIFQKICPHYSLNYYWDVEDTKAKEEDRIKHLNTYNEFVNRSDFEDWGEVHDEPDLWFNALFQIMVGLSALKRYYGMLHTDFHTKNILVQKVPPGGYWEYTIDGHTYYLPNLGYVFLIHDFGFGWIPRKMKVEWYYKKYLRHINKNGLNFYDINTFFDIVLNDDDFQTPKEVKRMIKKVFKKEEWEYVLSKDFYRQSAVKEDLEPGEYKEIMRDYPKIDKNYKGLGTTMADKIYDMFYKSHGKRKRYFNYADKAYHTKDEALIERYSLDIDFDKDKLPENFKRLVR